MRQTCPRCSTELPAGSSLWLCPKCVLAQAAAGEAGGAHTVSGLGERNVPKGEPPAEALPRALGDFLLLERIGEGGMGVVYKARQVRLDRIVAVKVLPFGQLANKEYIQRFRTEAVAAGSLQHPNIVAIHQVGLNEGQHYLVMEYVEGPTLAEVARSGPLPARRAARYVQLIAKAVHFAHERNILHRDLKPSNVLIDVNDQPRVTDFGLAKRLESGADLTLSGQVLGSPGYLPPEQASGQRGRIGRRSDVYSLGAILYHLLTGRAPFMGAEVADALHQVLNDEPVAPRLLNLKTPVDLETICLKCLDKEPARRYPTAQALAEELGRYLRDEPILSRPVSRIHKVWRWCRRKPTFAGLVVSAVGLLLVLGIGGPVVARQQHALADRSRQLLYASDLKVAHQAWELGNMRRVVELLDRNRPEPGQTDLREFTWFYLRRLCESYLRAPTLTNGSPVFTLSASRDGRWLASSGAGGRITVWDLTDPTVSRRLDTGGQYAGVTAISPDNRWLVSISGPLGGTNNFDLWDLGSGVRLHRSSTAAALAADFSPDGTTLAVAQGTNIVLREVHDWREVRTFQGHTSEIWDVCFSPDGRQLASGSVDNTIRLWDVETGRAIRILTGHRDTVYAVAFAPDGQRLASASGDRTVRLWDVTNGAEISSYAHAGNVMGVDFSPEGTRVASGSHDGLVKLWDLRTKKVETLRGHSQTVDQVRFVLGGVKLASGSWDGTVKVWDLQATAVQDMLEGKGAQAGRSQSSGMLRPPLAFSADGSQIFTLSTNDAAVLIWQTASGTLQRRWHLDPDPTAPLPPEAAGNRKTSLVGLAVSPRDGTCAVACELRTTPPGQKEQEEDFIELWNVAENRRTAAFPGRFPLCFSRDGAWLATGGIEPHTLQVTNLLERRSWTSQFHATQPLLGAVVFSPGGRLLAAACEGELTLFETSSGRRLPTPSRWRQGFPINALAFAPDDRTLAVGRFSPQVELWDVVKQELSAELPGHLAQVTALAISPDGKTLVTGDGNGALKLWSLKLREELLHVEAQANAVDPLAFSPDSSVLASGASEGVRLWRASSRQP